MDNFTDDDIVLFINKYTEDVSENPLCNQKIPLYVQYLQAKKHFRDNKIDEDTFFKKRLNITTDDLLEMHKLIDKIKRGKKLTKSSSRYGVKGNYTTGFSQEYSGFSEQNNYENTGFELLNEVQGAMDSYYKKMKKVKNSRNLRSDNESYQLNREEQLNRVGSVDGIPDSRYYYDGENSERPNIDFSTQCFAKSELGNMGRQTEIIQKLDNLNSILENNELITNDFDTEYKRSTPRLECNRKNTCHKDFSNDFTNKILPQKEDINQTRLWQDKAVMDQRGSTRKGVLKNKNPFEHHFDYLESNYNHVEDPRLIGESSRNSNRSMIKK
jgi:hypothetical protein